MRRLFCTFLALLLAAACGSASAEDPVAADEQLLKLNNIASNGPGLVAYLRKLSLSDEELGRLEARIGRLGSATFKAREEASAAVIATGPPALPALRRAVRNRDPEIMRRAEACIEAIEREQPSRSTPAAAVHLLVARKPAGTIEAFFTYLPFNEDEWLEEQILSGLRTLGVHDGKLDAAVVANLQSAVPVRRAAAAFVAGKVADPEQRGLVHNLLTDADAKVRLLAAQGLLAAGDRSAVPTLIGLLADGPTPLAWKAEELLSRVAGDSAPNASLGDSSGEARLKYRDAWASWWRDQGQRIDLSHFEEGPQQLGLTLVAEMDSNKVWEFGSDGRPRWKIERLQGPMDAQILPNGHVLIAEYQGRCVTEHDLHGHVLWTRRVTGSPIACQRLTNGNTFIATHNSMLEVTREGKEFALPVPVGGLFIFSAQKLANGHVVCMANPGLLKEFDATGKEIKSLKVGQNKGGWCSVEALPGGRYLVSLFSEGKVLELDGQGRRIWECSVTGASHAIRLPNGHTLVASMLNRRIIEVDRDGKAAKETPTDGRPWRVRRR